MNQKRLRLILLGFVAGAFVLFLLITFRGLGVLSSQSARLVELKQQNKVADAQATSLAASKKQVEQYSYFNTIAKTVLPSDKDQAQAVVDILSLADQAGISIASVTFPASTLGVKQPATTDSNTAKTSGQSAVSQAKPVEGIPGLYSLELTITPQIGAAVPAEKKATYPKLLDFLDRIERNRRTAQITQVNIQPETTSQYINFSLAINIFIKP